MTVTVQDTNNAPQSGLKVYAFNGSTYTGHSGTTASNGQVIFTLPQGSYRFRADFNGTQFWSNSQNDCTTPGCTSDSITVTLPVTITVQDTDGTAKSGLPVYAFTGTTYTGHKSTTDSNGQVSLTLPQGSYRFRADLNGTQFWSAATNTCTLPGCATASITVTKPLILTVQGQSGQPYPNLSVYAFNGTTYTGYNGTTDANGHATFTLPEGSYRFRADLNGTQFWSGAQNDCTVPGCTTATVTLPSNIAQQTVTINYTYDALNRLTSANYSDGNAFAYVYDAAGNVLQYTQTTGTLNVTTTYTYDSANQLATAQLGSASAVHYAYDADGNLLSNGVNTYAYDSADRLISVTSATGKVTMAYDGLGQRLSMSAAGVTTQYVLDNGQPLEATSGGKTTAYLYGVGPVGQQTDSWAYDLSDGTNTPRQLVSAQGQITFSARYTPWGDTLQSSGTGNFTYGYLGGLMDTSTGLLYMGSGNYYDPSTGRFLSRNAKPDQTNPYVPWGGNPTGALFTPLALLSLIYSRRKKRGTLDIIIILVVVSMSIGMSLTACTPGTSTVAVSNGTATIGTATVITTPGPNGTLTVSGTFTPTSTPGPSGTPTKNPSAICTASVTLMTPTITATIFFAGSDGVSLNDIGPNPSFQTPVWIQDVNQVVRFPGGGINGKMNQANAVNIDTYKDVNLIVIGYSSGGDAALIFADKYRRQQIQNCGSGKIIDIAVLGGTMTGKMTDGRDLAKEWPEVLDNLLVWGTNIYILEDKAAYGGAAAGYKAPPNATGRFHFEYRPSQEHWQGGYPGNGTNNSPEFRADVYSWFAAH